VLRRAADLVFVALLVVPFAFLAVARSLPAHGAGPELRSLLFWVSVGASAFSIVLSRTLPPRVVVPPEGRDATAFVRLLLAWALCEAAALLPVIAFVVTRDPRLVGVLGVDVLALVLLAPTAARWSAVRPSDEEEEVSDVRRLAAVRERAPKER
jgi:hypothetical protein